MKSIVYTCLFMFWTIIGCSQDNIGKGYIKRKKFEGYIIPKDKEVLFFVFENLKERFSPTEDEILKAEELLLKQIEGINKLQINQGKECPVIHKNLSKYKRQYVGYITNEGEKIIWMNFIWGKDKKLSEKLRKEVIVILDGCSFYWNIKVNLQREKFYDLVVNGSA